MKPYQIVTVLIFIIAFSLAYLASDQAKMISLPFPVRMALSSLSILAWFVLFGPAILSFSRRLGDNHPLERIRKENQAIIKEDRAILQESEKILREYE